MKKIIWITVAIIIILAWIYGKDLFAGQIANTTKTGTGAAGGTASKTTTPTKEDLNTQSFPIQFGDKGNVVRSMQNGLNTRYGEKLVEDGIYGNNTRQALLDNGFATSVDFTEYLKIIGSTYAATAINNIM